MTELNLTVIPRTSIQPSDILVYKSDKKLSVDTHCHITNQLRDILRSVGLNNKVIVLDAGEELALIGIDQLTQVEDVHGEETAEG